MHGWQANQKRTCVAPVVLGLYPKMKYPPLYGGIFIVYFENIFYTVKVKYKATKKAKVKLTNKDSLVNHFFL